MLAAGCCALLSASLPLCPPRRAARRSAHGQLGAAAAAEGDRRRAQVRGCPPSSLLPRGGPAAACGSTPGTAALEPPAARRCPPAFLLPSPGRVPSPPPLLSDGPRLCLSFPDGGRRASLRRPAQPSAGPRRHRPVQPGHRPGPLRPLLPVPPPALCREPPRTMSPHPLTRARSPRELGVPAQRCAV